MEIFLEVIEMDYMSVLMITLGVLAIIFGIVLIVYTFRFGDVPIIGSMFRKKIIHNELFQKLYVIQGIYTIVFGIVLLLMKFALNFSNLHIVYYMLIIGLLDVAYDFMAIKRSSRRLVENNE